MAASLVAGSRRHRRPPTRARLVVVALAVVPLVGAGWAVLGDRAGAAAPGPALVRPHADQAGRAAAPTRSRAAEVLAGWDRARSAAYGTGSVTALRDLYVGPAGAADVRLLRSYLRRGYRVEGIRMQLLAVSVRAHGPGTWLLRVTDRLAGGAAVGHGERVALPRDRASTRTVRLVRAPDGRWRVASVRG